jgi:hypothetical protein
MLFIFLNFYWTKINVLDIMVFNHVYLSNVFDNFENNCSSISPNICQFVLSRIKMNKLEYRTVIKFQTKQGKAPKIMREEVLAVYEKSLDDDLCQATVFCWQGILMIDFLDKGSTVTGEYYANLMHCFRDSIKVKRRGKLTQGVPLLRDNAPVLKSRFSKAAIAECDFVKIDHQPYSRDLVPCDYLPFPNLKKTLRGTKLRVDDELRAAVERHFADKPN